MEPFLKHLDPSQRRGLTVLASNDGGAIFHRVGTGKTRVAYAWFATIAKTVPKGVAPVFIVVCRRAAFKDWQDEAEKMRLGWVVVNYENYTGKNRTTNPRVFLVSHGILHRVQDELLEWGSTCYAVAFDEGFLFKNKNTKHCKAAHNTSIAMGKAAILSGSIMTARNLEDVFGQLYAINKHECLARTLTEFRSEFMHDLHIASRHKLVNAAGAAKRVSARIAPVCSIHMPASPRRLENIIKEISPSDQQAELFEQLREEFYYRDQETGMVLDIKSVPVLTIKCQQISDGYLKLRDGIIPVPSNKLEYLLGKIQELVSAGEKVVTWCAFRESVAIVLQRLQKLGIRSYGLTGGSQFDTQGWLKNGQVVVATEGSGTSINHFAQCAYAIYYSQSHGWLDLQQSQGRTDRKSSLHSTCWYYFLHTGESLDAHVHSCSLLSGNKEKELLSLTSWLQKGINPATLSHSARRTK